MKIAGSASRADKVFLRLRQELERLDDLPRDRRSRDDIRRGEIEFAGATAAGEVSILRADGDGFRGF